MNTIILAKKRIIAFIKSIFTKLSANAVFIKDNFPESFMTIKHSAIEEWAGDNKMVFYTINNQCDALNAVTKIKKSSNYREDILNNAKVEWCKTINGQDYLNWELIIYSYKSKLKRQQNG